MLDKSIKEFLRTKKSFIQRLEGLGVVTLRDFLTYFPWRYSDETEFAEIKDLIEGEQMTVQGTLSKIFTRRTNTGKFMVKAVLSDNTGEMDVLWFNQTYLTRVLKENMQIVITGKMKWNGRKATMMSPKYEIPQMSQELLHTGRLVPVYHETYGLSSKWIREKIKPLLYLTTYFEDPLPSDLLSKLNLMPLAQAISEVHFPSDAESLKKARYRLGFEELFIIQLRVLQRKLQWSKLAEGTGKLVDTNNKIIQEFLDLLPFKLTNSQAKTLDEIVNNISSSVAMSRLLEGDVGSGKTVVAMAALYLVVKSGYQGVLMVPTEILAKQHYEGMSKLFKDTGFNVQLLVGSLTPKTKRDLVDSMKLGLVDIVVGTHAIVQDKVDFKNLGLAVIDEQHRFGVRQRAVLKNYGTPHLLSMTATPIPRTLALTLYGDQDLSIIDEKPAGRQEIITRVVPNSKRSGAYDWIASQVQEGRQVFVVCPLVDESETLELKSAVQEYDRLSSEEFKDFRVGLLHGKMKQADKDMIMQKFSEGLIDILVSTTVIEVGIDVPNASIMLIEAADRFGLAQLHQLRGRVGRGEHQSYCFLFPESNSEVSRKRMKSMVEYTDGFKLAEIDLEMRGPGEVYGIRQSGIPDLKMASLSDSELLKLARDSAEELLVRDPDLLTVSPSLKELVELRDESVIDY